MAIVETVGNSVFHKDVSKSSYLAHFLGRRTLKHALAHTPLIPPVLKLLKTVDYVAGFYPPSPTLIREVVTTKNWIAHYYRPETIKLQKAIVYFHGGAFISCGLGTHRRFVEELTRKVGVPVLSVGYRQYPDAHFSDAVEDAVEAIEWLIKDGYTPESITLAGDSAGGGLALAAARTLLDKGKKMGGIITLSGWLDFTISVKEYEHWANREAYLPPKRINEMAKMILGSKPTFDKSPIGFITQNFPPILFICGGNEILRVDSERAFERCEELGVIAALHFFRGGVHAFPVALHRFPEGKAALDIMNQFVEGS